MTLAAELLQADKSRYAGRRTRTIRTLMTRRGIAAEIRTSGATLVTTIVVFSPDAADRASLALADFPDRSIRIVVRRDV